MSCLTSADLAHKYDVDIEWVRETKFEIVRQIAEQEFSDAVRLPYWPEDKHLLLVPSGRLYEEGEDVSRASIDHYDECITIKKTNATYMQMLEREREEWKRRELEIRVARQSKKMNPKRAVDIPTHSVNVMKHSYPRRKRPEEDYFEATNRACNVCAAYGYQCVVNAANHRNGCYRCASIGRVCTNLSLDEDPLCAVLDTIDVGNDLRRDILICLYNLREVAFELDLRATRYAPKVPHVADGLGEKLRASEEM